MTSLRYQSGTRSVSKTPLCFCSPCFEEEEHFKVLVKMTAQELSNGIPDSGHLYASLRASKTLTPSGDLKETFGGMDQVSTGKDRCVFSVSKASRNW